MGSKELSPEAILAFRSERADAWQLVDESVDPKTGFVPMSIIGELFSRGGVGTIVARDAMRLVDPAILKRAKEPEQSIEEE